MWLPIIFVSILSILSHQQTYRIRGEQTVQLNECFERSWHQMTELDCMDSSENKHVAAASLITRG